MLKRINIFALTGDVSCSFSLDGKGTKRSSPDLSEPRCSRAKAVILMSVCRDFFKIDHP